MLFSGLIFGVRYLFSIKMSKNTRLNNNKILDIVFGSDSELDNLEYVEDPIYDGINSDDESNDEINDEQPIFATLQNLEPDPHPASELVSSHGRHIENNETNELTVFSDEEWSYVSKNISEIIPYSSFKILVVSPFS